MYHLRANNDVLDDTWWESGGNALWKKFATPKNTNKETVTLFLEDWEWEEFEKEAKNIPGWTKTYPFPVDNPLWVMKQEIDLYICDNPICWFMGMKEDYRILAYDMYHNGGADKEKVINVFKTALKETIDIESARWELFGIKPIYINRMYATQRCAANYTGKYDIRFWSGLFGICERSSKEFTQKLFYSLEMKMSKLLDKGKGEDEDKDERDDNDYKWD